MAVEITEEFVWQSIPPRARDSHKGTFGSVLAVAGSAFYRGAALLAAEGALRTGAGIVTLASVEPVVSAAVTRLPECCLCPCKEGAQGGIAPENVPLLRRQKATVLLLGPGLGGTAQSAARAAETRTLVQQLLPGFAGAAVLDADGLNAAAQLLAEGKPFPHPAGELVVTPHPGEMARLTGFSAAELAADREGIALRYAKAWNAVVVLKGARTVVASPDGRVCVNPTGNPGLARGGSGDVLAGMLAALLACGLPAYEAAACAVYLHGAAADRAAAKRGEYGMLPHDILPEYLLVDGYNIIFAWDELNALAKESLDTARHRLMDILCNYQGYQKCVLILVFDAYRVPGSPGAIEQYHNIHVVYTKEAETADMFIERVTHEIGKSRRVRVATSDGMEQVIILGHGALRVSARMFHEEVQNVEKQIRALVQGQA